MNGHHAPAQSHLSLGREHSHRKVKPAGSFKHRRNKLDHSTSEDDARSIKLGGLSTVSGKLKTKTSYPELPGQKAKPGSSTVPLEDTAEKNLKQEALEILAQRIEDDLEVLMEKLQRERRVVLSNGLYSQQVLDLKTDVEREVETEKL